MSIAGTAAPAEIAEAVAGIDQAMAANVSFLRHRLSALLPKMVKKTSGVTVRHARQGVKKRKKGSGG